MNITLTPSRSDEGLNVTKSGDTLTINGKTFDFSTIVNGSSVSSPSRWIDGDVICTAAGDIVLTLIAPHGATPTVKEATASSLPNAANGTIINRPAVTA